MTDRDARSIATIVRHINDHKPPPDRDTFTLHLTFDTEPTKERVIGLLNKHATKKFKIVEFNSHMKNEWKVAIAFKVRFKRKQSDRALFEGRRDNPFKKRF